MNELEKDELDHQFADLSERINLLAKCIVNINERINYLEERIEMEGLVNNECSKLYR